nr:MAG TPA: Protein melan-A [Caudoviricetes sp.]
MYNDIIAGITIAGTFFTAGFIGAVWDFKRAQRKKARQAKQDAIMQQYEEDLQEKFNEGYQAFQADLAYARKHSYSDNDWSMADVL